MISKQLVLALIAVTTAISSAGLALSQAYGTATLCFVAGSVWFVLEINNNEWASWLFFLLFLIGAVVSSLENVPLPLLLLGMSTNLAAWDLSRFQSRIKDEPESKMKTLIERRHFQKLFITLGIAFIIALLPLFIRISVNFVGLVLITLLAMLVLRASIVSLHRSS